MNSSNPSLISRVGPMRLALLGLAIACYPMVFFADMEPEGIGIFTAYIVPSVVVMLFFVLMLDALMSRVFMIDAQGQARADRRLRVWLNLAAVGGLLLSWMPYFRDIGAL